MKKFVKITSVVVALALMDSVMTGCVMLYKKHNLQSQPPKTDSQSAEKQTTTQPVITEEDAKAIALEKAGLTADQVVFDRVELDREGGRIHYEVEFRQDRTEYSADVDAADGTIYDWEVDYDD